MWWKMDTIQSKYERRYTVRPEKGVLLWDEKSFNKQIDWEKSISRLNQIYLFGTIKRYPKEIMRF